MTKSVTVSYSELKNARRCGLKHELTNVVGWAKDHGPETALGFGTLWHEVMDVYYTAVKNGDPEVPERAHEHIITHTEPQSAVRDALLWMLDGYWRLYGIERSWQVEFVERKAVVELPQLTKDLRVFLKVKIDLGISDKRGDLYVDDHKTCSALPSQARQETDDQLPLYVYACRTLGEEVYGARYSYARKSRPRTKELEPREMFARRNVHITGTEATRAAVNAYWTAYRRYRELDDVVKMREVNPWLRSDYVSQEDCTWSCDFHGPCRMYRKGLNLDEVLATQSGLYKWRDEDKRPEETE